MPRKPTTEEALARIHAIREAPGQYDLRRDLAPFLQHKSNHVIAAAAKALLHFEETSFTTELSAAFLRLIADASKLDAGCKALLAIATTLVTNGEHAADCYLRGIRHVQMEGSFGPPVDAAAPLRGLCARGLVRMRHPDAMLEVVNLLADREIAARVGAVLALSDSRGETAELLLRLKLLGRDCEEVMSEGFAALLSVAPSRSAAFVARFLNDPAEEIVQSAALALGESRRLEALPFLEAAWRAHTGPALRKTLLLAIALLRQPECVESLLSKLKIEPAATVPNVLEALALYDNEHAVRSQVHEILAVRKLPVPGSRP
jgi:hypothetical protein